MPTWPLRGVQLMRVAIAGGHGKIGLLLTRLLTPENTVLGLIRNPGHADDIRAHGGEPVICDLERASAQDIAGHIAGCDAVVFAAGAGPGSGPERKLTVDRDGAVKLLEAATEADVPRYVIVSSVGAESPPPDDDQNVFSVYLRAKAEADQAVRQSDRQWTILRPGGLTDDPGTGRVRLDTDPFRGEVPREDVAAVIAAVLRDPRTHGAVLYVNAGDTPLDQALGRALATS
jgi:nucleoside-diphosphate-sugar epimerase